MTFHKILSENDIGRTGSHQAGILVPKRNTEGFIDFLPYLDPEQLNPDAPFSCSDENGDPWEFRYVYYNNRLHRAGTRDEYRITRMTRYLRSASVNDVISLTGEPKSGVYKIAIIRAQTANTSTIRLVGWTRKY